MKFSHRQTPVSAKSHIHLTVREEALSGVPQKSVLSPVSFKIFINGLDDGTGWTLCKFAAESKVRIQNDLNRQEKKWPTINKNKSKVLQSGTEYLHTQM